MSNRINLNNIQNLCFEGGGILGIAYIGALERLHQLDLLKNIKRYAGSSVGAMCAAALACGCTLDYLKLFLTKIDPSVLKDGGNIFKMIYRLFRRNGLYKGEKLIELMGELLEHCSGNRNITFIESYDKFGKFLIINGTSLNQQKTIYFSKDLTPDMKILDAIRISTCYPLVFQDVRLNDEVMIDGGFLDNYPIHVFDDKKYGGDDYYNSKTLGLRLMNSEEINKKFTKISFITDFIHAMIHSIYTQSSTAHIESNDINRTVVIDIGDISSMDFNITDDKKQFLIQQGYNGVNNFYNCQCILNNKYNKKKIKKRIKKRRENINSKIVKII